MSELTFSFQDSEIKVFISNKGVTWFFAQDVLEELEMSTQNAAKFLSRHVSKNFKQQFSFGESGRPAWYIAEPGVYQLAFKSKAAKALEFQDWVFEEVLPAIRKDGGYISPDATKEQLGNLDTQIQTRLASLNSAFEMAKELKDNRLMITVKSQLQNLNDRVNGTEQNTEHEGWLTISEILEQKYSISKTCIQNRLSVIGKAVKKAWKEETGTDPYSVPKHSGSGHRATNMNLYPPEWFKKIEIIAVSDWTNKELLSEVIKA